VHQRHRVSYIFETVFEHDSSIGRGVQSMDQAGPYGT
jgi:hypothetical protein